MSDLKTALSKATMELNASTQFNAATPQMALMMAALYGNHSVQECNSKCGLWGLK